MKNFKKSGHGDDGGKENRLPDYHIHTPLCKHAEGEVTQYRKAAWSLDIPEICFVDHAPNPDGYDPLHRMSLSEFPLYLEMVEAHKDGKAPHVLFGIEADYYKGCELFLEKWLDTYDFDYVLGSVHYIDNWGFDNPDCKQVWNQVDVPETWRAYFNVVKKLVDTGLYDAVGHLDLPKKFGHRLPEALLKDLVQPVLDDIANAGMGIELNTSGLRKPVEEIYPSHLIVSMACERDIPICFGSDAHSPAEVGLNFKEALELAQNAGYTHYFRIKNRKKIMVPFPETLD